LRDDPSGDSIVDEVEFILHMTVRTEDQGEGARTRGELLQVLRGQGVQPGESIRSRHRHDVEVGEVDYSTP
jgi:hypothetical protein